MVGWARAAVVYQVCPRSFKDSNGDGVGDLAGILAGLPHIVGLGVDALWITPFYASPMADFGYDVADFTAVDPLFGGMDDFDAVVVAAHASGLKVIVDQVWGHSSDRHPWFIDSRSSACADKADWYVWADAKPDGSPPNNWLSVFGGPAWTWEPRRRQYYLHHFLACQPALNWRNPAVAEALFAAGAFWQARGVDGFRLDAVDFLLHDPDLRDNPPRPHAVIPARLFGLQQHRFDMAQPDLPALLERMRARFPALMLVGELSSEPDPLVRAAAATRPGRLSLAYTLGLMKRPFTAAGIRGWLAEAMEKAGEGGLMWAFSNHDVARVVSRWGDGSPASAKMLLALLLALPGGICLYQGEELGLPEAEIAFEHLQDPYGKTFYPQFKGRDGCRTPMPWTAEPAAGFTTGTPWLPIPSEHLSLAIDRQEGAADSVLRFARNMLRFRRQRDSLRAGALRLIDADPRLVAFERRAGADRLLCLFNPTAAAVGDWPAWGFGFIEEGDPAAVMGGEMRVTLP